MSVKINRHSREGGNPYDLYASQYLPDRSHSMSNILWIPFFKGMTALVVGLMLAMPTFADDEKIAKKTKITAIPIELNEKNPQQKTVDKLRYIKGYHLTSSNPNFGGVSGLSIFPGIYENWLRFITDNGYWGAFIFEDNFNIANDNHFYKMNDLPKDLRPKVAGDSEAISIIPRDEGYVIFAFEQRHRIIAYDGHDYATSLPLPAQIDMLRSNGGIETMEGLSDGRLLLMAEHPTRKTKQHLGWIGTAPKDDPLNFSYETRLIAPPKGYSPTDATELPNGDVLVLLRRYTPADGVSAKFWRIKKTMLDSSDPITGEIIATLAPPLTVDNMEGIAVIDVSEDGNPIIAVISDDNFNPLQRTLLMIFEVKS